MLIYFPQNTVQSAVDALATFPSLKNVLIVPRSPRADNELLADVSEYGNDMLVSQIASTGLGSIKRGSMKSIPCKTVCDKNDLFGSGPKRDLIHMRGPRGRHLYTDAIVQSIRSNGLSIKI